MEEKVAFVCNANCQNRNKASDEQINQVKSTLQDNGYDVRTKGCLDICAEIEAIGFPVLESDIVNVQLHNPHESTVKRSVAGMNGEAVGIRTVSKRRR